jgi:ABC-type sugar transport system ATPase subunit
VAIDMTGIDFSYGPVEALKGADFHLDPGEVVALVGDNGAGKSTLIKILAGVLRPDAGTVEVDGETVDFKSPRDARDAGIETLYQDLALLDNLDVTMNFFVGREKTGPGGLLRFKKMRHQTSETIHRYAAREIDTTALVQNLSGGQRQVVALSRAIGFGTRYLLLDEPTSALSPVAAEEILETIRGLARQGFGVVVITHNVEHAFKVADRIVVLRLGRVVGSLIVREVSPADVVSLIVGANEVAVREDDRM